MKNQKICGIYKITNPEGKIYIGKSIDIFRRLLSHKNPHKERVDRLASSLINFGWENHFYEIIFICEKADLNFYEWFFIKKYNSLDEGLNYNCTPIHEEKDIYEIVELSLKIKNEQFCKSIKTKSGRKEIPDGIRLNLMVPKKDVQKVKDFVLNLQKEAIKNKSVNF